MPIKQPEDLAVDARKRIGEVIEELKNRLGGELTSRFVLDEILYPAEKKIATKYVEAEMQKRRRAAEKTKSSKTILVDNDGDKKNGERNYLPHAIDIYAHVRQLYPVVAVLDLGVERNLLTREQYHRLRRDLGIDEFDYGVDLRNAREGADLVVDVYRCLIIWNKKDYDFEFNGKEGAYFLKLVDAARNGRSISYRDFSASTALRHLADWKSRLKNNNVFPSDLWKKIVVGGGRHKLNLPAGRIRFFLKAESVAV